MSAGEEPAALDPEAPAASDPGAEGVGAAAPVGRRARNAGVALFFAALIGLVILAIAGFKPALYLLVLAVVGTALVVIGARLH